MDEEQLVRTLAAKAKQEAVPPVDVADRVLAAIARGEAERAGVVDRPLAWVAACAAVAAVVLAVFGAAAWNALLDPVMDTFNALTWVTL